MTDVPVRIALFVAGRLREGFLVERYSEEWAADLECIDAACQRWKYALSLLRSVKSLKRAHTLSPAVVGDELSIPYSHVNSKGIRYYLWSAKVTLRGGKEQTIYYFAKVPSGLKGSPAPLPNNRVVKENPRNGFLTISNK
ncbi:hypothetical protein [Streptomyces griseorubiginosus]|uniref:hypothetical protein n=1 Tax=Streptomyces griseorubiginosus TaxID=67304 RepID=UPI000A9ECCBD|nr:hypothetical protein [Streptomyces griseorubiginosus]